MNEYVAPNHADTSDAIRRHDPSGDSDYVGTRATKAAESKAGLLRATPGRLFHQGRSATLGERIMHAKDIKTLTEHVAFMERMTANSRKSHGWVYDVEIEALKRMLAEVERLRGLMKQTVEVRRESLPAFEAVVAERNTLRNVAGRMAEDLRGLRELLKNAGYNPGWGNGALADWDQLNR